MEKGDVSIFGNSIMKKERSSNERTMFISLIRKGFYEGRR
jgi:hypothetical protein